MLTFASKYGYNQYSQFGEDGILSECLSRIKHKIRTKDAVEFGGHNGFFCSNTAVLRDKGWKVSMYDLEETPPHVQKKMITPDNVNYLPDCSVLCIDVDGNDYNIWAAYSRSPDIVIIEVNSSYPPTSPIPVSDPRDGTAYLPMLLLGQRKGYFLLCHTGNMIFVLEKHRPLFPEVVGDGIANHELYFNTSHL